MRTILILIILLAVFSPPGAANTLEFRETYYDYNGFVRVMTAENLNKYPLYSITILDNGYTLSRLGETVILPKRTWIDYKFYPDRIRPVITIQNYAQINNLVTKVSPSEWYLTFPWSASKIRSVTDKMIDMGVFKRSLDFTITDSNTSCNLDDNINCPRYDITPKIINGDIRLYFNPQSYSTVVWPLKLTENTITVSNSSTSGWSTSNVIMNGTRYTGDGSVAMQLNSSYLSGLVAYYSMDETATSGTTVHNVNTLFGYINTTNQGAWNGTISSTPGHIGNAGLFNGIDDYVAIPDSASLNMTTAYTIKARVNRTETANDYFLSKYDTNTNREWAAQLSNGTITVNMGAYDCTAFTNTVTSSPTISNNVTYEVVVSWDKAGDKKVKVFVNGTEASYSFQYTKTDNLCPGYREVWVGNYRIGSPQWFTGTIDEVAIWNRQLSASEISVMYNAPLTTYANMSLYNESAVIVNVINRTRVINSNVETSNTMNLRARINNTSAWTTVQDNITSNTWYDIPIAIQNRSLDFDIVFSGTGADTAFLTSLEWDETAATVSTPNSVAFNFTNMTISETQIYQSSQATKITVDVNDSDGTITAVTFNFTLLGTQYTLAMANEGGDTWSYSFISSVTGVYNITSFNATDNSSGTNGTLWGQGFTVVPVGSGGESGSYPVVPTITPIETFHPIDPVGMAKDETGQQILYGGMLVGLVMVGWSTDKRKQHKDLGVIGILIIIICAYGLGVIVV